MKKNKQEQGHEVGQSGKNVHTQKKIKLIKLIKLINKNKVMKSARAVNISEKTEK